jgi:hypothetical protein
MVEIEKTPKIPVGEETRAEYSPWAKIFMRIELICDKITEYSIKTRMKEIMFIEPLFNSLLELYDQIHALLIDSAITKFETRFANINTLIKNWKKDMETKGMLIFPEEIVNELQSLKRDLFDMKQIVGLGVPTEKVVSIRRKLNRVMGLE